MVPFHGSKDLPLGTRKAIVEGSGIPFDQW
ncbi:MAG: hypothetical protein HY719_07995 [Planctomycetes bacterium]|nr:hypothetical protein [Planctomycetota bacterium]